MNLENCTKKELVYIIEQISQNNEHLLKFALEQVKNNRKGTKLELIEQYGQQAQEAAQKYVDVLKPYNGIPTSEIPHKTIQEAMKYYDEYKSATKKEAELIQRTIK